MNWQAIAEARYKEWKRRREAGDAAPLARETPPAESIESQLFEEARSLKAAASRTGDPEERDALLKQADKVRIRLMVMLEKNGYPLLARTLQERLDAAVDEEE